MQAPEIQTMYSVPKPVATIRTRIRQEFERNRFVNKLSVVDMLIFRSHADYQVSGHMDHKKRRAGFSRGKLVAYGPSSSTWANGLGLQETMNFWRQQTHIMSYFKEENFRGEKSLPSSFMSGFLEVRRMNPSQVHQRQTLTRTQGRN